MLTQTGYGCVDDKRMRTEKVARGDYQQAHNEEGIQKVSMSASNQINHTIRKSVSFSKQLAKADKIENTTPHTPEAR